MVKNMKSLKLYKRSDIVLFYVKCVSLTYKNFNITILPNKNLLI